MVPPEVVLGDERRAAFGARLSRGCGGGGGGHTFASASLPEHRACERGHMPVWRFWSPSAAAQICGNTF